VAKIEFVLAKSRSRLRLRMNPIHIMKFWELVMDEETMTSIAREIPTL
jgi:hypothetical protein